MNLTIQMKAASYTPKRLPVVLSWFGNHTDDRPGARGGDR